MRWHELSAIGFKHKFGKDELFKVDRKDQLTFTLKLPFDLVEKIKRRLQQLSGLRETAAIVYDKGVSADGTVIYCAWLLSPRGIEAAAETPVPTPAQASSLASGLRMWLGVTAKQASRAPVKKDRRSLPITPADVPATPISLDGVSKPLFPEALAHHLLRTPYERILILPTADLASVPFAALTIGGVPLIDLSMPVILGDISALFDSWRAEPIHSGKILVVGNPDLSKDPDNDFPEIPASEREAKIVAELFGVEPLLGAAASKRAVTARLKEDARKLTLIYFATHALSSPTNPMGESFLALAGGNLLAYDAKRYSLDSHPLIVMSACQTALGKSFEGGIFGLARAWHYAGASKVVMSLWDATDTSAEFAMTEFMTRVKAGIQPELALRESMRRTRQEFSDPGMECTPTGGQVRM